MPTPIIIGVGDIKNRSNADADAKEPAQLIYEAIQKALKDTGASDYNLCKLQDAIDSIDVVRTWTWTYPDLPGLIAEKLSVKELKHKFYSDHGGNQPGKLFDEAAKRIARGECGVAVVTGGEALASLSACAAAKKLPPPGWTTPSQAVDSVFTPTGRDLGTSMNSSISSLWQAMTSTHSALDLGAIHNIGAPIHVYPLYENAFRAHRGQSIRENNEESAKLYAEFSSVAEKQEFAWNFGRRDREEVIGTVGKKNRMICFPYPLLMNAFNTVNLAAAVILTTTDTAKALNIPSSKWIYPLGGAGTADADFFWDRPNFYTSPSISRSIDAAFSLTSLGPKDIDLYDIYSCFPIVPKLAAQHLGIPSIGGEKGKKLTLLGGLTSFGGAGNNYSMHALTEMTRALRDGRGQNGLVLCNGGVLSYQHVVILSKKPRADGQYPEKNPLPAKITDIPVPELEVAPEGDAVIETYTVEFGRDGKPAKGFVIGRMKGSGKRFLANAGDDRTLRDMGSGKGEIVGLSGWVRQDPEKKGRGLFTFDKAAKI